MQSIGEVVLGCGREENGLVLPSFKDGAREGGAEEVLCLTAFASCIDNGSTLNAIY